MHAAVVVCAGIRRDHLLAQIVDGNVVATLGDPLQHGVVDFHDRAARGALGRHVGKRCPLVGRQCEQTVAAKFHHAIEGVFAFGVGGEDVQHHVLGGDAGV